jgi:hypothetical protein
MCAEEAECKARRRREQENGRERGEKKNGCAALAGSGFACPDPEGEL